MLSTLKVAIRFTLITAVVLGLGYPLAMTALAHLLWRNKADGQLITRNGQVVGSAIIGQNFASDGYFHSRPSAAGNGYDAGNSSGSNYAQSNKKLVDRIQGDVATDQKSNTGQAVPGQAVPIDLVTASGSGLDPDITPAAALYQVHRVAQARHMSDEAVRQLVLAHVQGRQLGVLGEARVNVLALNLALDDAAGK
jgi:potassium-transporting ATPase KdpC subunit